MICFIQVHEPVIILSSVYKTSNVKYMSEYLKDETDLGLTRYHFLNYVSKNVSLHKHLLSKDH